MPEYKCKNFEICEQFVIRGKDREGGFACFSCKKVRIKKSYDKYEKKHSSIADKKRRKRMMKLATLRRNEQSTQKT